MINLPIPFIGCKRYWNHQIRELLKGFANIDDVIIVDLFGGSGYCSLLSKSICPNAQVIYNDYDYYTDKFKYMADNMKVLNTIRKIVNDKGIKAGDKLPDDLTIEIINMLKALKNDSDNAGNKVDKLIIDLFSSCLCFQFSQLDLDNPKQKLYNKLTKKDYSKYMAQYDNLEIVHKDWETLYNEYKGRNNVVFILDPPYPMTYQTKYKGYSFLNNQLKIIDLLKSENNVLLFSSEKSFILDCYNWKYGVESCNQETKIKVMNKTMTCLPNRQYQHDEILIYKLANYCNDCVDGSESSESVECLENFKGC